VEGVATSPRTPPAADAIVEGAEAPTRVLEGRTGRLFALLAAGLSLYALHWVVGTVEAQAYRVGFLLLALVLTFLAYPASPARRARVSPLDWALVALAVAALAWPLVDRAEFPYRAATPGAIDLAAGIVTIALVLEATRRTVGGVLPATAIGFLLYAYLGPLLELVGLGIVAHRGYAPDRLVGTLYMTLEGIFGVAVDVSSSLIILFTIFGAFLQHSGAGKFFIDFSLAAMGGKRNAAGRAVVVSSFLLGGPSGSGVATTVMIGSVAYPMLAKAGFGKDAAGGLLAAGGLGAIISPPVLGAAAFLIAEFLRISYLDVIWMAVIPTCLYYFSLFLMVELDARRFQAREVTFDLPEGGLWALTRRYGFHFVSLVSIIAFMLLGFSPVNAVFWATVVTFGLSFLRRECALFPKKLIQALADGSISALNAAVTCAAAGIIVGVVTLTGLGLKFSSIVIVYAGGSLLLTAIYTALIVWIVGLAVPVTASYIICAVIAAPALIQLGVPEFAAHMFIFYYAVLSEVSPPTALSCFAAAAITGGDPYKTTLQSWKYTMPAFLVPFVFVLAPDGVGLLLKIPQDGSWMDVGFVTLRTVVGIAALAATTQNWMWARTTPIERAMLLFSGVLLVFPGLLEAIFEWITGLEVEHTAVAGIAIAAVAVALHRFRLARA